MKRIHTLPSVSDTYSRRRSTCQLRSRSAGSVGDESNRPDATIALLAACLNTPSASPNSEGQPRHSGSDELMRLHNAISGVTPENHPRTAKLLGSSTRKAAQKVIEEAGEVALEAVKHRSHGVVRESA